MRVTMLDYGAGNLHSLEKAMAACGADVAILSEPDRVLDTDVFVLPGVGAFAGAADCVAPVRERLRQALAAGLPCLAICLGMQLLFDTSEEGPGRGIGLLPGAVRRIDAPVVPHMGWNTLDAVVDDIAMASGLSTGYYAHSFVCRPIDSTSVTAWTTAGNDRFPAIVRHSNTIGVQFHPEKSSTPGLRFIRNVLTRFARECALR